MISRRLQVDSLDPKVLSKCASLEWLLIKEYDEFDNLPITWYDDLENVIAKYLPKLKTLEFCPWPDDNISQYKPRYTSLNKDDAIKLIKTLKKEKN